MATLPARAQRPVGVDLEVPDLGAEPVRAPQHLAAGDDPAADPGAEGDQQHLGAPARRTVHELGDHRDVGVVVDDGGETGGVFEPVPHRGVEERGHVG